MSLKLLQAEKMRYELEVYEPGSTTNTTIIIMGSDQPFTPFQKGDIINPRCFPSHHYDLYVEGHPMRKNCALRVVAVEHMLFSDELESGKTKVRYHKIGIHTEAVEYNTGPIRG